MLKNRFFADENSSSNEESSDDEQEIQVQTVNPDIFRVSYNANSDDEDNVKRVVRSKKEKRYEEVKDVIEKIQQAIRIRDFSRVYECFENLIKAYDKTRRVIEREQSNFEILDQLDHFVNKCWSDQDWCNKLSKTDANHLNTLRQKLRRYLKQQPIPNETIDDESVEQEHALSREEEILKKLDEINSMRGKRGMNYENQFESLTALRQQVDQENLDVKIVIKILLTQITISLDYHHQENEYFKLSALDYIEELLTLLPEHTESNDTDDDDLIALIIQMNEKYRQNTDPSSQDYIERLKDEFRIYSIFDRLKTYFESTNQSQHLCTIYLLIIEHMYYKYDKTSDQSSITFIARLCKYIFMNDTLDDVRTRASLCQIYHLALHDYYHEARDLMLMCHIQDTIHLSDIPTQILYNRTMVQLGLCAFRLGKISEAHQALVDLQSRNQIKELLGQDMHINLQLIECIYLISAMLIEIPSTRKHVISKGFYNLMYRAGKQPILGPPESMHEHIIAASQAMKIADWNTCVNFLINDQMKNIVWKFIPKSSEVIEMLINKVKEESLRIYLITSATCFSDISISALADMFQLPIKSVYGIISKMIINQELMATIDPSDGMVLIHETNPSKIQSLSVELMEKVCRLHEQNHFLSKTIN